MSRDELNPSYVEEPLACPRCKRRGKTWPGGNPRCAFKSGAFSHDNWNCATANAIRWLIEHLAEVKREEPAESNQWRGVYPVAWIHGWEDQHYGVLNVAQVGCKLAGPEAHHGIGCDERHVLGDVLYFSSYKHHGQLECLWILDSYDLPRRPSILDCEKVLTFYKYDKLKHQEDLAFEAAAPEREMFFRAFDQAVDEVPPEVKRTGNMVLAHIGKPTLERTAEIFEQLTAEAKKRGS